MKPYSNDTFEQTTNNEQVVVNTTSTFSLFSYALMGLLACVVVFAPLSYYFTTPVSGVYPKRFEVTEGMSVKDIAEKASREHLVRSELLLYAALSTLHDPTNIHAGTYVFSEPRNVIDVAAHIASSDTELELLTVTFPEGIRAADMGAIIDSASTLSEYDVLILASIVEREANDEESMRMVAGIFQNRLDIGMALQADASIEYVLDVPINELREGELAQSLRELDSPYNTYLYPGLPPTPIGNPGLQAISAVLNPLPSDYYYYITGNDGVFYYAETLDEHNANIARYLR